MILKRMYRTDQNLENFGYLEGAIESNKSEQLKTIIIGSIKDFKNPNSQPILTDHLLLESIEICLIYAKPDCLKAVFEVAQDMNFTILLTAKSVSDCLSVVSLLATSFQSKTASIQEIFDCLEILHDYNPDLLIECAGAEFKSPADAMSSFCFFFVQLLKFRSGICEKSIISLLEKLRMPVIPLMLGSHKMENTKSPTVIHYLSLYGKAQLLEWIINQSKHDDECVKSHLERAATFGEEIGLIHATPLICAIAAQNIDTVSCLIKEGVSIEEKCHLHQNVTPDGRKVGNKERRQRLLNEANSKSPLEICGYIKNKNTRIAIRCLLRNRKQPIKSSKSATTSPRKRIQNKKDQNQNLEGIKS